MKWTERILKWILLKKSAAKSKAIENHFNGWYERERACGMTEEEESRLRKRYMSV